MKTFTYSLRIHSDDAVQMIDFDNSHDAFRIMDSLDCFFKKEGIGLSVTMDIKEDENMPEQEEEKLSLSDYCKEKDRIKEELKWKEEELEEYKKSLDETDDFAILGDIECLEFEIKELEEEWDQLHGDKK